VEDKDVVYQFDFKFITKLQHKPFGQFGVFGSGVFGFLVERQRFHLGQFGEQFYSRRIPQSDG
jgi:hypothetical protein